jgi:hypothetical protein
MEGNMKVSDGVIKKFFLKRGSDTSDENVRSEMAVIEKNINSIYKQYKECVEQTEVLKEMIDKVKATSTFPSENRILLYDMLLGFTNITRKNLIKLIYGEDKYEARLIEMDLFLFKDNSTYTIPFFPGRSCVVLLGNTNLHNYDIGVPYVTEGWCGQRSYVAYICNPRHGRYLGNSLPRRADIIRVATMDELLSATIDNNYYSFSRNVSKLVYIRKSISLDKFREIITKIITNGE